MKIRRLILALTAIAIISVTALSLAACSNATTQGQLENVWYDGETYVYEVTDTSKSSEDASKGVYRVSIKQYAKGATIENFGGATLKDVKKGFLISGELDMNNGASEISTKTYFELINGSNFMVPYATSRIEKKDGAVKLSLNGLYSGTTLNYDLTKDGETTKGSLTGKLPLYDNNEIHQVLRSAPTLSTNFAFSFNVLDAIGGSSASLTASCKSTVSVKNDWTANYKINDVPADPEKPEENTPYKENGIECYKVTLSIATIIGQSKSHELYYAKPDVTLGGWALKKTLIRFIEPTDGGEIVYDLKEAKIS